MGSSDKDKKKERKLRRVNKKLNETQESRRLKFRKRLKSMCWFALVALVVFAYSLYANDPSNFEVKTYTVFWDELNAGDIEKISIYKNDNFMIVEPIDKEVEAYTVVNPNYDEFVKDLLSTGVDIEFKTKMTVSLVATYISLAMSILWLLGVSVLIYFYVQTSNLSDINFVRSDLTFDDIGGLTEIKKEIKFTTEVLNRSVQIEESGGRCPKGLMFYGPPGTGKTMLAKAISGEAKVPFLSISGADITNSSYVGAGTRKLNRVFKTAELLAPCVVFIDEIDAMAGKRKHDSSAGADRAGIVNALLQRMDGASAMKGILVIGATNNLEVLDQALLRPGRFDKQFFISPPVTRVDRDIIIGLHIENKKLAEDLSLEQLSSLFVGMSGAEIEGVLNDAVLLSFSAKDGISKGVLTLEFVDRALMSYLAKGSLTTRENKEEDVLVAYHEAGHAVVALACGQPISKVTILPYGATGGSTMPKRDNFSLIKSQDELEREVKILYGGLLSEKQFLNRHSSGCANDLARATDLITQCVESFGMSTDGALLVKNTPTLEDEYLKKKEAMSIQLREDVESIIENNVVAIQKLADRLLDEGTVYNLNSLTDI